jgi:oxygen-independent coproporphyrinogen-3 oxidase
VEAKHVYVHVPFCARKCSYCDFAIAVRRIVPVDAFVRALEREIALRFAGSDPSPVDSIYLGGGTPSRLGAEGVAQVLTLIRERWPTSADAEVTIEANPDDVTPEAVQRWRDAGASRISLGVQSFNDDVLRWMHRTHDAARAIQSAQALGNAGFDWSLDLIFALPPEVSRSWSEDIRQAIDLEPPHISTYGLSVEPHTPLLKWRDRGEVHEADEERYEEEFLEADRSLADAGYEHYEVSNYARPGSRALHNAAYWRRVPYIGLGPSAHSFDGSERRWNAREYQAWFDRIIEGQDPVEGAESIDDPARELEEAYLGLRTTAGIPVTPANAGHFDRWRDRGWANVVDGVGVLTPFGWLRLDSLVADLTDVRSR